jgi:hypothetical protein
MDRVVYFIYVNLFFQSQREGKREVTAFAQFTLDPYFTAVVFHDLFELKITPFLSACLKRIRPV